MAPVPGEATGFIGGYLFGILPGFIYSSIGLTAGSWLNFTIGRQLGVRFVRKMIPQDKFDRFDTLLRRQGVIVIFILFVFLLGDLSGIGLNIPASADLNGNSGIALLSSSPSASSLNPSVVNSGIETSLSYLYSLPDLPYAGLHMNIRFSRFGFCSNITCLNHPLYRETSISGGVQLNLSYLESGISCRYIRTDTKGYDSRSSFELNGGINWTIGSFTQGFSWLNASGSRIENVLLPVYLISESIYQLNDDLRFGIGIEKENNFDFSYRIGADWKPFEFLGVTTGYQLQPERLSTGVRFIIKKIVINYSIRTHQELDLTHYISLSYELKKN